MKLFW